VLIDILTYLLTVRSGLGKVLTRQTSSVSQMVGMRLSFNLLNIYTTLVNVYSTFTHKMAANNKMQMVLSHDNSIIISNGQQPSPTAGQQPSMKFIDLNIPLSRQNITLCY